MRFFLGLIALGIIFSVNTVANATSTEDNSVGFKFYSSAEEDGVKEEKQELNPAQQLEKKLRERRKEKASSKRIRKISGSKSGSSKSKRSNRGSHNGSRGIPSVSSGMFVK